VVASLVTAPLRVNPHCCSCAILLWVRTCDKLSTKGHFINIQKRFYCAPVKVRLHLPGNLKNPITMNKAELIDAISTEAKITKADASRALEAFMNATTKSLKKGERVALVGFGTFTVSKRAARNGRNPQTGKPIKIAARKVAKFKAGLELAAKIK
jgi:DNA-binding protein HU-beta